MECGCLSTLDWLIVMNRWVHLTAVIIAVGGTVFLRLVLHPAAGKTLDDQTHQALRAAVVRRWSKLLHLCILLIIATGIYNAVLMFPLHKGQPLYHTLFGVKVIVALLMFFLAIALTGRSAGFEPIRRRAGRWLAVNILLAAIIVLLSNVLKNLPPTAGRQLTPAGSAQPESPPSETSGAGAAADTAGHPI